MSLSKCRKYVLIFFISISLNFTLHAQLKDYNNQSDYLVITPTEFVEPLKPFANWRQSKELDVKVVELQQIYLEFPDSTKQSSIRNFISYSLTYWSIPPKFILLVGDTKLLPSNRVHSRFSNNQRFNEDSVSIDDLYSVNIYDTDVKPDVCLGRFPVANEEELKSIISKTIYFEDSLKFDDYDTKFTFLADITDSIAFENAASRFINESLPSNYFSTTIFSSQDSSIKTSRNKLINSFNYGTLFFSYYGHGAKDRWSEYNLFTLEDIDSLQENNFPFIYSAVACSQSFDLPNDSSIVRKLIVAPKKGSVASIASTGLSYLSSSSSFLDDFYNNIFSNPNLTIGEAVYQTKLSRHSDSEDGIQRRYTLLGDPALKIPIGTISQVIASTNNIKAYILEQNYPNPFNPSTNITFIIPETGVVKLNIYNILGEIVSELVNANLEAGFHQYQFNASNLSSGIYFYSISVNGFTKVKKMNLIK